MSMGICWFDGLHVGGDEAERARQDEEGERFKRGDAEPPNTCDACGAIVPDGEGSTAEMSGAELLFVCATCAEELREVEEVMQGRRDRRGRK